MVRYHRANHFTNGRPITEENGGKDCDIDFGFQKCAENKLLSKYFSAGTVHEYIQKIFCVLKNGVLLKTIMFLQVLSKVEDSYNPLTTEMPLLSISPCEQLAPLKISNIILHIF